MGKKSARRAQVRHVEAVTDVPVVGGREPCPCGSGRRYKACHGRQAHAELPATVRRPFAGFASECDWVALRNLVPAATAPLTLRGEHAGTKATLVTLLPGIAPALRRDDGEVLLALQVLASSGDANRDLTDALTRVLDAEPGTALASATPAADLPNLTELVDADAPLEVTVHESFGFWLAQDAEATPDVTAALDQANAAASPTARLRGVDAAYWTRVRDRSYLRWVMPHEEEHLLDALARLHAAGNGTLGPDTKYAGAFRADGLVVPVWDLPADSEPDEVEKPAAEFHERLTEALAVTDKLTADELRARAGIVSRQLTLR
jgi:hypothetical protein